MALTLIVLLLLPVAALSHMVKLTPSSALLRAGERSELTCSMTSCTETVKFTWTSLEDKPLYGFIQSNDKVSVMIFDNVTKHHENRIICKAKCGTETKQAAAKIKVYSFPRNPVISGTDRLKLGEESTLTCEVSPVYPAEFLEVEWLDGETLLYSTEGDTDTDRLSLPYTFKPSSEDDGKTITCRASLNVEGIPDDERTKETSVSIRVLSEPHNVDIKVSPSTTVSLGSNLTLTCGGEGHPRPSFTWSALKPDGQSVEMGRNQELVMYNVSLSDAGIYQCEVSNPNGQRTANVSVDVLAPPMNTIIKANPQAILKEGQSVNISCQSDGVPVDRVVLSRVVNGLQTELKADNGAETSVTIASVELADSGLYVCQAFNKHGSQKDTFSLTVEAHPLEVALQPNLSVITAERGSSLVLSCQASGCPQPSFIWKSLGNIPIPDRSETNGFLSQLFLGPVDLEDEGTYICEVKCGSIRKSEQTEVKVFSFPAIPVIESSGSYLKGEMIHLICTVQDVFPADLFQILWLDGERELHSESGPFSSELQNLTSVFQYRMEPKDQGKRITCKVLLDMHDVPSSQAVKTASTTLTLHYPPRGTRITVNPQTELKEGESMSISCRSESVPVGRMVLSRMADGIEAEELKVVDGAEISVTLPSAELTDSGLYVCEASNPYGSHRDSIAITVKAPPRNTTVEVFPSRDVQEGQNITICCHSVSFPPPAVVLKKLDGDTDIYSPDGVFLLVNLTPNDTGLYQVNVTNDLGYETEIFTINVMEKSFDSPPSWDDFIVPAVCLGVGTALVGVLEYLRRAKKKGSYNLTKCKPGTV